jgi:hypothetical protein
VSFDAKIQREFLRRVRELEQRAVDVLCCGRVESFDDYKQWTGYLRAIKEILEALEASRKAVLNEGREEHADSTDEDFRD